MDNNFENGYAPEAQAQQPAAEQPIPEQPAWEQPAAEQPKQSFFNKLPKPLLIILAAAIPAILLLVIILSLATNTFRTPLKHLEKQANLRNAKKKAAYTQDMNGFCEKEARQLTRIMKKTDSWDDAVDYHEESIENMKDEYGSNYKYTYKLDDKDKIDREDYKDFQDDLRDTGEEMLEELRDLDSDDIEDLAEELDISKAQARKVVRIMKKVARKMKYARVSGGYELEYETTIKGKELDDPIEYDGSMTVYKINGRWISLNALYSILNFF